MKATTDFYTAAVVEYNPKYVGDVDEYINLIGQAEVSNLTFNETIIVKQQRQLLSGHWPHWHNNFPRSYPIWDNRCTRRRFQKFALRCNRRRISWVLQEAVMCCEKLWCIPGGKYKGTRIVHRGVSSVEGWRQSLCQYRLQYVQYWCCLR